MGHRSRKKAREVAKGTHATNNHTEGKSSVSPIHALVPDVLVAIFSQALNGQVESDYRMSWNRMVPMNISAVCHQWREITLASPILWSTIKDFEVFGDPWGPAPKFPWKHFQLFLRRSGQVPLDISIKLEGDSCTDYGLLSSALHDNQTRLRNIDIEHLPNFDYNEPDSDPELNDSNGTERTTLSTLPVIEELRITSFGKMSIHLNLKHAPFLRRLALVGGIPLSLGTGLLLPNLVNVILSHHEGYSGFDVHDCIMLLQASPYIEEFVASSIAADVYHHSIPESSGISVRLSRLSVFNIMDISPETAQSMLEALTLPNLLHLSVHVENTLETSTCGIYPLLKRSKAALKTLDLSVGNTAEIVQCLQSAPDLQMMILSYCGWNTAEMDDLLKNLTLGPGIQTCPRLKKMTFSNYYVYTFDDLAVSMIQSRWSRSAMEGGRFLEAVQFENCLGGQVVSLKLEESRKEGLDIVVINSDRYADSSADDIESLVDNFIQFEGYDELIDNYEYDSDNHWLDPTIAHYDEYAVFE